MTAISIGATHDMLDRSSATVQRSGGWAVLFRIFPRLWDRSVAKSFEAIAATFDYSQDVIDQLGEREFAELERLLSNGESLIAEVLDLRGPFMATAQKDHLVRLQERFSRIRYAIERGYAPDALPSDAAREAAGLEAIRQAAAHQDRGVRV